MEEVSKVVSMTPKQEVKSEEANKSEKISYEDLVNVANQLQMQVQRLREENLNMRQEVAIVRMNFLFDIVDKSDKFPEEIVVQAIKEISDSIYPSEEALQAAREAVTE